jgi:predicted AAA+ superfamily ATPase
MAALSNKARIGEAFDLLAQGLAPFVNAHMKKTVKADQDWAEVFVRNSRNPQQEYSLEDPSFLLNVMIDCWRGTFDRQLPRSCKNLTFTLRDKRNEWAHNRPIKATEAQFTLSGIHSLLESVDAKEADPVRISLEELSRTLYEKERDRDDAGASNVLNVPTAGLKPWREVIHPHTDVSGGDFNVAEFAADLDLVRRGEGSKEYTDPRLFFDRTYLTEGLRALLTMAVERISGKASQPVVNCQTNFGGGKTHSLISLYHLFSGAGLKTFPSEISELVEATGVKKLPAVNRAVVVGNRFAAGETHEKPDGTVVNTIWGEIAWQLGGAKAYAIIADSDQNRSNPGNKLEEVFASCSPSLILIDEWVAYARELYARDDLPGGSFDSQFGFAQALTEAARAVPGTMLVVSIPASEGASSAGDDASASSIEVGGVGGRQALDRLTTVVGRQAENWRPAQQDEPYKIVRRRLFQPFDETDNADCAATAEAFGELYRSQRADFPSECSELAYVERIKNSYPIHPEVFDRLYQEWSTVERFQQTRGVLRLMAATIHSLWESDDKSPLILPCSLPLDDQRVAGELANKLPDHWGVVIDADIDSPQSRAATIDREVPSLGAIHAARRVARTIFIGATPNVGSPNQGIEVDRIRLGSVFAGEQSGPITDALNRLRSQAPYLYSDRERYWFDTQQNVTRTARDDADRLLSGDRHEIRAEIERRLRAERSTGEFARVHIAPGTSNDVADEAMARLVVLSPEHPHIAKSKESPALEAAREVLNNRGNGARQYRNMLIFAAADQGLLERLEETTAEYLAWASIVERKQELNLDVNQSTQATNSRNSAEEAGTTRLAEAYKYALVPHQPDPSDPEMQFDVTILDSTGQVAERASRKLISDGALQAQYPPVLLRAKLDSELSSRWNDGHVAVSALWEDFARYVYLPRLKNLDVLVKTAEKGPASVTWASEGFGVAAGISEDGKYLGLVGGADPGALAPTALLVRPEVTQTQLDQAEEEKPGGDGNDPDPDGGGDGDGDGDGGGGTPPVPPQKTTSFRGTVSLDPNRSARAFGQVSEEVLTHLISQVGVDVEITVTIVAKKDEGFSPKTIRDVTENSQTLKFDDGSGFTTD